MKAKTKISLIFYSKKVFGYLALFFTVLAFGYICDKLFETVCIIIAYISTRFLVPKIKHFNSTQKCISISTVTFLFAIAIVCIPKNVSLIWSLLTGASIPLIMYAESLLFDVKISDEEKLRVLCKKCNYNELKTQIAIKFFIRKEKPKDVWLWLCETQPNPIEWDSVNKMKYRMKKELFKD